VSQLDYDYDYDYDNDNDEKRHRNFCTDALGHSAGPASG